MFATASTGRALVFLTWCVTVGLIDNVLELILLRRGVAIPRVVVFLGVIGGLLTMGTIGLFVGAIVLTVGYKLLLIWLEKNGEYEPIETQLSVQTTVAS